MDPLSFQDMAKALDEPPCKKQRVSDATKELDAADGEEEEPWDDILDKWQHYKKNGEWVWWNLRGRCWRESVGYGYWWPYEQ